MQNLKESSSTNPRQFFRHLLPAASGLLAGAATLLGLLAGPGTARAEYTVTYEQVGTNVVATGSGTLDTDAMTNEGPVAVPAFIFPNLGRFANGTPTNAEGLKVTLAGPSSFGSGAVVFASSGSGDVVGLALGPIDTFWLPAGYVSGSPLSDTATYTGETLAGLGLTPGDYTWTWGSGPTADSFNLDFGAVPEPTSVALFGLGGLALLARRPTRQQ